MKKFAMLHVGISIVGALLLLRIALFATNDRPVFGAAESTVLIEKVYPDGLAVNDLDEAVMLINVQDKPADISGWGLSDTTENLLKLTFPEGTILAPFERIWIARNGAEFRKHFGEYPDFEQADSGAPSIRMTGSWPGFANKGDEVLLADSTGQIIDGVVYESGDPSVLAAGNEWSGATLEFYSLGAAEGQILFRKRDISTGLPLADTNSTLDWGQDQNDPVFGRRVQYPGWETEQFSQTYQIEETAILTVAIAPDNAYETINAVIKQAQSSILIETHTFESHDLLTPLLDAADRGVEIKILLEGAPPGGVSDAQRYNCFQLAQSGGNCFVMHNDSANRIFDRYTFLHAKFMVVDNKIGVVGSDNLSPNSWPADRKDDGTFGRRGVVLLTDSAGVVSHLNAVFAADLNQAQHHDILDWYPTDSSLGFPLGSYSPVSYENGITYTVNFEEPAVFRGDFDFELVQVPENFLNPESGLLGLLSEAGEGDTLLVQQQYERFYWGGNQDPIEDPNLRISGYLTAARRGSTVRILLDSFFDNTTHPASNWHVCKWLTEISLEENLDLECQLGNPTGLGIHNKMVLAQIDGRGFIHVGSVNGSEQSAKGNRELALQVQSNEAYDYLATLFQSDFVNRVYMPLVLNRYEGPVPYPLISEVLYNPFGADDGAEFIEISNGYKQPFDLSGYSVSDGVTPADYADLRRFPTGTILPVNGVLVVAQQAVAFEEQFFSLPDFEILDSHPDVPELVDDLAWGDPSTFLRLGNSGDVVFLRNAADQPVDVLVYGEKVVEGYPTCPAVTVSGASLRRRPFDYDTGSCDDFEEWGSPSPGVVP